MGEAEILHASRLKHQNINTRSNTVTNSVKTFKMVHNKKKKKEEEGIKLGPDAHCSKATP